jgi:tRNA U34 5-methylaminomethyl-2-thiouridine-forming methyltransferase MnmC
VPTDPSDLEPTVALRTASGGAGSWAEAVVETEDGSRTFASARYGETYRSSRGAHAEARHVFVEGTGVARRLALGQPTRVVEVGLGAATNFALTAAAALAGGTALRYEAW